MFLLEYENLVYFLLTINNKSFCLSDAATTFEKQKTFFHKYFMIIFEIVDSESFLLCQLQHAYGVSEFVWEGEPIGKDPLFPKQKCSSFSQNQF